jgi:hypothetical protein
VTQRGPEAETSYVHWRRASDKPGNFMFFQMEYIKKSLTEENKFTNSSIDESQTKITEIN